MPRNWGTFNYFKKHDNLTKKCHCVKNVIKKQCCSPLPPRKMAVKKRRLLVREVLVFIVVHGLISALQNVNISWTEVIKSTRRQLKSFFSSLFFIDFYSTMNPILEIDYRNMWFWQTIFLSLWFNNLFFSTTKVHQHFSFILIGLYQWNSTFY